MAYDKNCRRRTARAGTRAHGSPRSWKRAGVVIYTREPAYRAIDRELSTTAASVLQAAMESGGDPTAAIEQLRDRNLGLQEERGDLLRQLGLPADYLTDSRCAQNAATPATPAVRLASASRRVTPAAQGAAFASAADCRSELFQVRHELYSTRPDGRSGISPRENMEYNLGECEHAAKFGKDSPNLLLFGSTGLGKTFLCIARRSPHAPVFRGLRHRHQHCCRV